MNIFLDFDGTVIDVSERYYRVHEAALGATKPQLTRDEYWQLKRRHISEADILRQYYADVDVQNYAQERGTFIECPRFLRYDRLLPQAVPVLEMLNQARHRLYLLTLRRNEHNLRAEVDSLGLGPYFRLILTASSDAPPWEVKAALLRPHAQPADWIVGDTEADIRAGQMLGLHTCAVASGIRTEELLRSANPERSLPSIEKLPLLL